jgi:capsular polysaccharide biosynthesis protein
MSAGDNPPGRLPAHDDDFTDAEAHQTVDFATGLVSLSFITAALRRSVKLWCLTAVAGLLISLGLYAALTPQYQATTSILLAPPPNEVAPDSILTDQALAHTDRVAELAIQKLRLRQSVNGFLNTYTVTDVTDRVLLITVTGPSSKAAVSEASALATEFLLYRAGQVENLQKAVLSSLDQQINQARQHIRVMTARISQLSAQPVSPSQRARLDNLRTQRSHAITALSTLQQTTNTTRAASQAAIALTLKGSQVLDAAVAVPQSGHSRLKRLLLYAATGLIMGLALGMSIVIVRALVSDRLRRRDDVAAALGAPVKLSVGTVRLRRWPPNGRGLAAARRPEIRRIVAHLGSAVPAGSAGVTTLAVVPVDETQIAALALASLAVACAQEGFKVVVADLCPGSPSARLLGAADPGIQRVSVSGTELLAAIPGPDDVAPRGPLRRGTRVDEPLAAGCASADVLLTFASLDPSLGGEHLATWATDAVVTVTAGRSSGTKIHAVGEMVRLSGVRLVSAVLVGADKTDESLGVTPTPGADQNGKVIEGGMHADAESFTVTAGANPGREASYEQ